MIASRIDGSRAARLSIAGQHSPGATSNCSTISPSQLISVSSTWLSSPDGGGRSSKGSQSIGGRSSCSRLDRPITVLPNAAFGRDREGFQIRDSRFRNHPHPEFGIRNELTRAAAVRGCARPARALWSRRSVGLPNRVSEPSRHALHFQGGIHTGGPWRGPVARDHRGGYRNPVPGRSHRPAGRRCPRATSVVRRNPDAHKRADSQSPADPARRTPRAEARSCATGIASSSKPGEPHRRSAGSS